MNGCTGRPARRPAAARGAFALVALAAIAGACHHSRPSIAPPANPAPRTVSASPAVVAAPAVTAVPDSHPARPGLSALQHDVDAILAAPALARGYWGVLVKSLDTNDILYAMNARKLMMPASNMKIVTLAATAERLGWDYRYDTRVVTAAAVEDGSSTAI